MNEINDLGISGVAGLMARWSHETVKLLKGIGKIAPARLIKNQQGANRPGNQGGGSAAALGATFGDRLVSPHQGAALAHRSVFSPVKGSGNKPVRKSGWGVADTFCHALGFGGYGRG
jgi:hypothetical protein